MHETHVAAVEEEAARRHRGRSFRFRSLLAVLVGEVAMWQIFPTRISTTACTCVRGTCLSSTAANNATCMHPYLVALDKVGKDYFYIDSSAVECLDRGIRIKLVMPLVGRLLL